MVAKNWLEQTEETMFLLQNKISFILNLQTTQNYSYTTFLSTDTFYFANAEHKKHK